MTDIQNIGNSSVSSNSSVVGYELRIRSLPYLVFVPILASTWLRRVRQRTYVDMGTRFRVPRFKQLSGLSSRTRSDFCNRHPCMITESFDAR
jgi:hypothetical protein